VKKPKKNIFIPTLVILSILAVITGFVGFCFWIFSGGPTAITGLDFSSPELSFLTSNGFLEPQGKDAKFEDFNLKPLELIEQNLNSANEKFEILAAKLDSNNYQMAFKLENKTEQEKEFYLIPVSKESQLQFEEIKGIINNKDPLSIKKEDVKKEPLAQLYDVEKHKKELNPELAKAYEDIKKNGYSAKPVKITLSPKSTLLAQSDWKVVGGSDPQNWRVGPSNGSAGSAVGLKPVYLLVYGSAGGAKDDLVILNVHSHPRQGDNWEVSFTTKGIADLRIIPNDQSTIDDDEFVSLLCNNEKRTPQILEGDVVYYPSWECLGTGKVIHYTKKAGKHRLRFEFGNQIAFAYNGTCTWDGSSSNLWNVAANWDVLPSAGDDLIFPSSASNKSNSNDFPAGTSFNSITFNGSGYTLAGNSITLVAGIIQSVTSTNIISLAIILGASQTVDMQDSEGILSTSGIISDGGSAYVINKIGTGQIVFGGANTFSGGIVIKNGSIRLNTSTAAAGTGTITIGDSSGSVDATLFGGSTATYANQIVIPSGSSGISTISSYNNPTFSGAVTLNKNLVVSAPTGKIITLSGVIADGGGSFGLSKASAGRLTLSGNNTFSGGITIKNGLVEGKTSSNAFGVGTVTLGDSSGTADATLQIQGAGLTFGNAITVASGSSGILKMDHGSSGSAIYGGNIALNNNVVFGYYSSCSGAISGTGNITFGDTGNSFLSGSVNNIGTITNSKTSTGTVTISGIIGTNVTGITQNSATSALTLSGVNTYTGPITNSAGTLNLTQSTTYSTMTLAGDTTTTFTNAKTFTLTDLTSTGTAGHLATINSASAGSAAILTTSTRQIATEYLSIKDSTPVQTGVWYAGAHSTLVSNTGNWVFTPPPAPAPHPLNINDKFKINSRFKLNGTLASAFACGDTLTDTRDSKTYATVQIGSQCWMRQNINVGTLTAGVNAQGTDCPSASAIEKYCYDDSEANCTTYGGLYQWNQAMCGSTTVGATGICPTGWHIPTHDEYTALERAVCTSGSCATDFPYDISTTSLRGTNEGTTLKTVNSSSFSALMSGYRSTDGTFAYVDVTTVPWSSLQSSSNAWYRKLDTDATGVYRLTASKAFGFSVRCVKD
jgi:uncharacterized protein (TIGR02145 family)